MNRKMTCWVTSVIVASLAGFIAGTHKISSQSQSMTSTVQAQDRLDVPSRATACVAGLLQGSYAFMAEGKVPSTEEHYTTLGIMVFDGQGKLSLSNTQSVNGRIVPPTPITGIYFLTENCGGRITLSTGSLFDVVVSNNGRDVYLMQVNSGYVISGMARKL